MPLQFRNQTAIIEKDHNKQKGTTNQKFGKNKAIQINEGMKRQVC
jgi:hypothetical protein